MLLGEDFGRCHKGGLKAIFDRLQTGQRSHHGLAAADVALQQATHRMRLRQVGADFLPGARLRGGKRERQRVDEGGGQLLLRGQGRGIQALPLPTRGGQRQLLRQQFVEGQPLPRGVLARFKIGQRAIRRRLVQQADAGFQFRQTQFGQPVGGQGVGDRRRQRARDQLA